MKMRRKWAAGSLRKRRPDVWLRAICSLCSKGIDVKRQLVLDGSTPGLTIPQIYLEVILPAQEEIGRMWVANEITVAEEHFATATSRTILAQLLARAPIRPSNGKTVMTAAVAGNRHDIGLQVVCDFFEMDGWRAIHLGADVPIGDLVAAVDGFQVDLLALSAAQSRHLEALRETIAAVRESPACRGPQDYRRRSGVPLRHRHR